MKTKQKKKQNRKTVAQWAMRTTRIERWIIWLLVNREHIYYSPNKANQTRNVVWLSHQILHPNLSMRCALMR